MKVLNPTSVRLKRGAAYSETITASPIRMTPVTLAAMGVTLDTQRKDWVVDAADLKIAGVEVTPQPGDQIVTATEVYAVVPLVANTPAWSYTTTSEKRIRIETELFGEVT